MLIMGSREKRPLGLDEPLRTRRTRTVTVATSSRKGSRPAAGRRAGGARRAACGARRRQRSTPSLRFSQIQANGICNIQQGAGKIPFICFDLAGGANIAGSNVLVGKEGGQLDFLSTQGYSKQGLPGDHDCRTTLRRTSSMREFGLMFHSDSAFLRGMLEKTTATTRAPASTAP